MKIVLIPLLLAGVTFAGRKWGQNVAGGLGSLPIVAGPVLLILSIENGNAFGARAAQMSLAGIAATMLLLVAYARVCSRAAWPLALAAALVAWFLGIALLYLLPDFVWVATGVAAASLWLAPRAMQVTPERVALGAAHPPELPTRMLAGATLALITSALGARICRAASGYAALFPVVGLVASVFSQISHGAHAARSFLFGMTRGMWSVASFCLALVLALPRSSVAVAFALAVGADIATHALMRPRR